MALLEGLYAEIPTFFTKHGVIDEDAMRRHISSLKGKLDGVFALGAAGEFAALSDDERMRVCELVIEECGDELKTIINVGATSTKKAIVLGMQAADAGADAVAAVTPYFTRTDVSGLVAYYSALRSNFDLPVLAYNVPYNTGVNLPIVVVEMLARDGMLDGIIDASCDCGRAAAMLARAPHDFSYFTCSEAALPSTIALGGAGGVLQFANLFPDECAEMYRLSRENDIRGASKYIVEAIRAIDAMSMDGPASLKMMLAYKSDLPATVRPPQVATDERERAILHDELSSISFAWGRGREREG